MFDCFPDKDMFHLLNVNNLFSRDNEAGAGVSRKPFFLIKKDEKTE